MFVTRRMMQSVNNQKVFTIKMLPKGGDQYVDVSAREGRNLMDVVRSAGFDMEGACDGSLACSTCHVIVRTEEEYQKLGDPSDEEEDLLELTHNVTDRSRLGCQLVFGEKLSGIHFELPDSVVNLDD
eukprot:TRINITY_DN2964_c0_g1_i1.p1 TRINITY_DN2964_c0_g1~~TRINITY_DN2964_c0_g1_i1.p1  ORF type:complete len:127 (-),score=36.86 TRINITY_DN2964_c0_g1_i1:17-397(-)